MTHAHHTPPANWTAHALEAWRTIATLRAAREEAEADRDAYRELAQQALHALAELTERHCQQSDRYHALLDERRERRAA